MDRCSKRDRKGANRRETPNIVKHEKEKSARKKLVEQDTKKKEIQFVDKGGGE